MMMLLRKSDRLENFLKKRGRLDIEHATMADGESVVDTIGDLRRYLILVESWHVAGEHAKLNVLAQLGEQIWRGVDNCATCKHHRDNHDPMMKSYVHFVGWGCTVACCTCEKFIPLPHNSTAGGAIENIK
jgi:hypothetical protein